MYHSVIEQFCLDGKPVSFCPHGNGHINQTLLVETDIGKKYILQQMNTRVFHDIPGLMANMASVTEYLKQQDPDPRHVCSIIYSQKGIPYVETENHEFWRLLEFVGNSISYDAADTPELFAGAGTAFGEFQKKLSSFPAETLKETIPAFHHTPSRLQNLLRAAGENKLGRLEGVRREVDFFAERADQCSIMTDYVAEGKLPLRVTHNDTKLNNILFDKDTGEPLCIIDLDTVMPGLAGNDFGDAIRFGASTAAEDEKDLDLVSMSMTYYNAFSHAFVSAIRDRLTKLELETLPLGAKLMTMECGMRFLTDYLEGDVYFKTAYADHNLVRARTQIKLTEEMEFHWNEMNDTVLAYID